MSSPVLSKYCLLRKMCFLKKCKNRFTYSLVRHMSDVKQKPVMKCMFSGIQPTGVPHLGNYFGAIKNWVRVQDQQEYEKSMVCIVDLHSITMPQQPESLRYNIRDMAVCLLACGVDPQKTILFQQSAVSQHAELSWVLGCLTTMPRLQHLPQWKQKSETMKEVPLGLFTYPVLQSADILLYRATDVPVGDDQVKHVELARHLANLFNRKYGFFFPKPKVITGGLVRMRSLRSPTTKMSKSEEDPRSRIELTDTPDEITEKLRKSVSDHTAAITYDPEGRPGVSNLVDICSAFTGLVPEQICLEARGLDTLTFKQRVADVVIEGLRPVREEFSRLKADPEHVDKVLISGNEAAREIAEKNYTAVRKLMGLL